MPLPTSAAPAPGRRRPRAALRRGACAAAVGAACAAAACGGPKPAPAPPAPVPAPRLPAPPRAAPGDTLYLIEHFVRADRRVQFERFLVGSYWPAVRRLALTDSASARVLRQTRVLYPARPNDDGTFTYVFVTDPVVRGESYNVLEQLRRVYGAAETERRYRELTESWARPFAARPYVQPAYPADGPPAPAGGGAPR